MTEVPAELRRLPELARNLWWSWHPDGRALLESLRGPVSDPRDANPVHVVQSQSAEALARCVSDPAFMAQYQRALAAFDRDMTGARKWFPSTSVAAGSAPIAYFSAEFGVHSALPVYSGGLGVLAGDFAKEASDLGVPLVGVGFMYPQGYFRQRILPDGRQVETYQRLDPAHAPMEPACVVPGCACVVPLQLPDRVLHVAVWLVRVGAVRLYLMDTDLEANHPWDRELSARLYGGDQEMRLRQEILLGIGGVRLLRALQIAPAVWHANEGHSAFMLLERVRELIDAGSALEDAGAAVRASSIFTTHTPVPAGHDAFPFPLIEKYLASYWPALGLDRDRFLELGAHDEPWGRAFNMTALAMRLSGHRNAVSKKHGEVSRRMWRALWPEGAERDAPIVAITNGIHVPSWISVELARLFDAHLGKDWIDRHDVPATWQRLHEIPDDALWRVRRSLKVKLIRFLRDRARGRWAQGNVAAHEMVAAGTLLDPDVLTLGFARRFATYKRAYLILSNLGRLRALLTDSRRPIQLVFAGKAHPADEPGKHVLQTVYRAASDPACAGRITFVEDYDIHVAQHIVQGVDVWLNTPRPPLEASGTSGQKAALNGVPNLSILDGWWAEAHDGTNGWAIDLEHGDIEDHAARDEADAAALYRLLETSVIPLYYDRDAASVPVKWLGTVRRTIQTIAPHFSTRRMMKEYVERLYRPAAEAGTIRRELASADQVRAALAPDRLHDRICCDARPSTSR